jgi:hypothetical protein
MITFILATALLGAYSFRDYLFGPRDDRPNSKFLAANDPDRFAFPVSSNDYRQKGFARKFNPPHPDMVNIEQDFSLWKDPKIQQMYKYNRDTTKLLEEHQFLDPLRQNNPMGVKRNPYISMNLSGAQPA